MTPTAQTAAPLDGAAAIGLAVAGGRLARAMSQADMVQVLVTASELDSMVRDLGPLAQSDDDRAALIRAKDLIGAMLEQLESRMAADRADRQRDQHLRRAYTAPLA